MNSFSVFGITDKKWAEVITQCKQYDFYHTPCYQALDKGGDPLLFVAQFGAGFLAMALIVRKIEQTDLKDCTSVYGYCGPVSNLDFKDIQPGMFAYFRSELKQYFKDNNIVTVFSRLHPIIIGDELFTNFGTIRGVNKTVAIDLDLSPAEQVKQYRGSIRSEINQLRRKKGYTVHEINSEQDVRSFMAIHHETMDRKNAGKNYYFGYEYFYSFLNNTCFTSKLLVAIKDGEIAAGAIFTIAGNIMQYHLAGTKEEYIRDAPMKLILDEARLAANQSGLKYLHLGGSVGDSDDDPLFRFKAGFSDVRFKSRVWQYIADEEKYNELNQLFKRDPENSGNYFPLYRS
jgi:hypothetical protein